MDAAHIIRNSVAKVTYLRAEAGSNPELQTALTEIKRFQALRFTGTYADLLASKEYGGATHFFLDELYSDHDYSQRDDQFAKIAGALQTFFPHQVVATAVSLAQLHVLTEELDWAMSNAWVQDQHARQEETDSVIRYMRAWKTVGRPQDRSQQLTVVLEVGQELTRLTRTRGLRLMLKMMRRPAMAAGLGSLQHFLETGFDTFAGMSGQEGLANEFLNIIHLREKLWLDNLFGSNSSLCENTLRDCLAKADVS